MSKYLKKQPKGQDFGGKRIIKNAVLVNCTAEGGSIGPGGGGEAVKYTEQDLTTLQQTQARTNIGAASAADVTANATAIAAESTRAAGAENTLQQMVSAVDRGVYREAWDGSSTPVVANIPAGVVVTYNGTDYTGTLAASADNTGDIYLVSDGNGGFDRYTSSATAPDTFTWVDLGNTDIALADYATKAEVDELEQEVNGTHDTTGKYLDRYNAEQTDAAWGYTDYIPYTSGNAVVWKWGASGDTVSSGRAILFYDSSKTFISNGYWTASGNTGTKTIAATSIASDATAAAYLRASFLLADGQDPSVTIGSTVAWEPVEGLASEFATVKSNMSTVVEKTNGIIKTDVSDTATVVANRWVSYADGTINTAGSSTNISSFLLGEDDLDGVIAISARAGWNITTCAVIAFFSTPEPAQSSYIKAYSVQSEANYDKWYYAAVPANAKSCYICNRAAFLASPECIIFKQPKIMDTGALPYVAPLDKFFYHFEPSGFLEDGDGNSVVPSQSLADITIAARLGFKFIEANVHATADDKFVCLHGDSGNFGTAFGDTYASTAINSLTLAQIKENVRYASDEAKYQVAPPSLEEFCERCNAEGIGLYFRPSSGAYDGLDTAIKYMGNRLIVDSMPATYRSDFGGVFTYYTNTEMTDDEYLAIARNYGAPFVLTLGPTPIAARLEAETLAGLIEKLHEEGFLFGFAGVYQSEMEVDALFKMGADFSGSGHQVNNFSGTDVYDLDGDPSQFTTTGSISAHVATLASGQTLSCGSDTALPLGKMQLRILFSGTLGITFGEKGLRSVTSDGTSEIVLSDYVLRQSPQLTISASASTTISTLVYSVAVS